jgi:hypothetical protein
MSGSKGAMGSRHVGFLMVVVAASLLSAACTTQVWQPAAAAAVAPQMSVERFLQAANSRDLTSMGRLFGTEDGPMGDTGSTFGCMFKKIGSWFGGLPCRTRQDVEIQMNAISSVLVHQNYRIVREEMVAGRDAPTTRVLVDLTIGGRSVQSIPFEVVQAGGGRWLIQNVDLSAVMAGR